MPTPGFYRHLPTKKPATLLGRGLAVSAGIAQYPVTFMLLLQLHSLFLRSRLLLCQAMDIAATQ